MSGILVGVDGSDHSQRAWSGRRRKRRPVTPRLPCSWYTRPSMAGPGPCVITATKPRPRRPPRRPRRKPTRCWPASAIPARSRLRSGQFTATRPKSSSTRALTPTSSSWARTARADGVGSCWDRLLARLPTMRAFRSSSFPRRGATEGREGFSSHGGRRGSPFSAVTVPNVSFSSCRSPLLARTLIPFPRCRTVRQACPARGAPVSAEIRTVCR